MNEIKDVWKSLKDANDEIKLLRGQKLELRKHDIGLQNVILDLVEDLKSILEYETCSTVKKAISDMIDELEERD